MQFRCVLMVFMALLGPVLVPLEAASSFKPARSRSSGAHGEISYEQQVRPLLDKYGFNCHGNGKCKGDLSLDGYRLEADAVNDPMTWEKVLQNVRNHVMPPENKPRPSPDEVDLIARWVETRVFHCDCDH